MDNQGIKKLDAGQKAKALREACAWGEESAVKALIKAGAEALAQAPSEEIARPGGDASPSSAAKTIDAGDTALGCAARAGFVDIVRRLLSSLGGNAEQKAAALALSGARGGETPAMAAASSPTGDAIGAMLCMMDVEPACSRPSPGANGPAWSAARAGNARALARVAEFVKNEMGQELADDLFEALDEQGRSLLHCALASGSGEAVKVAIERGPASELNRVDYKNRGVWLCAAEGGSWEPFDELVARAKKEPGACWARPEALLARDAMGFAVLEAAAREGGLSGCKGAWAALREFVGPEALEAERGRAIVSARRAGKAKTAEWLVSREEPCRLATKASDVATVGAGAAGTAEAKINSAREVVKRLGVQASGAGGKRGRG